MSEGYSDLGFITYMFVIYSDSIIWVSDNWQIDLFLLKMYSFYRVDVTTIFDIYELEHWIM